MKNAQTPSDSKPLLTDKERIIQAFITLRIIAACEPYSANLSAGLHALELYMTFGEKAYLSNAVTYFKHEIQD